jgi:tetratricopeptide (TPR) repeat protein
MWLLNFIKSVWANRQALFRVFLWALVILSILAVFKYVFLTNCINVGSVKECVTSVVDSSGTLFAVGSILVAIVALVPTFWIESKIRDAKEEIRRVVLDNIQESMLRLNKAQILIFEADKLQGAINLLDKELLIEEAISLWPLFKQQEHRKLGNDFSLAVIGEFYQGTSRSMSNITTYKQGTFLRRDQIALYLIKAIFYLEETIQNSEAAGREELVNLACMYGCVVRYEDMIRTIERAIRVDENAKDDFQEAKRLSLLVYTCGSNRQLIEKLGKKVGKDLPLSKSEFTNIINKVDITNRADYLNFIALKKHRPGMGEYVYVIKITATEVQGQRLVSGLYLTVIEAKDSHDIPPTTGQQIPIEDFFDEVDKELFIICFTED